MNLTSTSLQAQHVLYNYASGSVEEGEIIDDTSQIDPSIFNDDERKVFDFTMNAVHESCEGQCSFVPNKL